ncbi:MAG TPA: SGNH/GDSL hydrolase family protein [Candidatus Acidoferrales bacterium]|nr:SGNH/GDSL hydrolase family protein [Candidatus Acidoferrales bacterium]
MKLSLRIISLSLSLALTAQFSAAQNASSAQHWVGTWAASPQMPPPDATNAKSPDAGFNNQTVRMIVRVSLGGNQLRVRLSNAFGNSAVTIGPAHVALAGNGAAILPGTDRALTFSGHSSFTIPTGAEVMSDPVHLDVPALASLAVSVFLPAATGPASWHALGNQTTYISGPGDFTASPDMPVAKTFGSWYWLSGIEVLASEDASAIVTLGDSITDGAQTSLNANHRWPDVLADQLAARRAGAPLAVLNEGISGNRLLHDVAGPNALARFDRDVLSQDGVRYLIVLEGVNDIGWPHIPGEKYAADAVSADDIIAALRQIAERAHAHGIIVYGCTLTPFGGAFYETPDGEAEREAVNQWIRAGGGFDGVIDFDKLTRDPAHPQQLLPAYDSGDHLHPGDVGYEAMGHAAAQLFVPAASASPSPKPASKPEIRPEAHR